MKKTLSLVTGLSCILILAFPMTSSAEWMTGGYLGYSVSDDEDISLNANGVRQGTTQFDFDDSFTLGYRLGYWFESAPWLGISGDISYFRPDVEFDFICAGSGPCNEDQSFILGETGKFDIIPITPLLMLRIPLAADETFPKGKFQPYVAAGPGIFFSSWDINNFDDSDARIGWDARAGIAAMVAHNFAVFAEYRYTEVEFTFDEHVGGIQYSMETNLNTHHYTIGLFYYF